MRPPTGPLYYGLKIYDLEITDPHALVLSTEGLHYTLPTSVGKLLTSKIYLH